MNHRIFVQSNKNEVLLIYCSFSFLFFFEDQKLKKFAVALKFLYLVAVLSFNSKLFYQWFLLVLFACKGPCPLYKSLKRRNHHKPENLETLFLLSALKMSIKSVISYQTKIKYLEEA